MLAGDVVALYYKGDKFSKVTGSIDYSRIYNNGKYSFIYVQAEKGQPEVLYYGGMKFAKIAQTKQIVTETRTIGRYIEPEFYDSSTYSTTLTTKPWQTWEVTWQRDVYTFESGATIYDSWRVKSGNPNFPVYEYPEVDGYHKPSDEPAVYAYPGKIPPLLDGGDHIRTVDGRYLK